MNVVLIEGDGIGPEVIDAARQCLEATDADIEFEYGLMGQKAIEKYDTPLPDETVEKVKGADAALKGPVRTPIGSGYRSVNVELRKRLDLYANVRPAKYMPGVATRIRDPEDIDIVVVRENLEDLYMGIEFEEGSEEMDAFREFLSEQGYDLDDDFAASIKPISRSGSERVIRFAFEYALENGREKVTAVDKSNIMKYTDGLFKEVGEQVAEDYDIEYEHVLVDNMAQQLVMRPEQYDVVVTQNIYGDIHSDLTGGLVGGIGMAPSGNIGDENTVFEAVHGTAPDIAGEGKANPSAAILSGAMMLEYLGEEETARQIREAVREVVEQGENVTGDLGGSASTDEMTEEILERL